MHGIGTVRRVMRGRLHRRNTFAAPRDISLRPAYARADQTRTDREKERR
jgi:hypothetical protein